MKVTKEKFWLKIKNCILKILADSLEKSAIFSKNIHIIYALMPGNAYECVRVSTCSIRIRSIFIRMYANTLYFDANAISQNSCLPLVLRPNQFFLKFIYDINFQPSFFGSSNFSNHYLLFVKMLIKTFEVNI